MSEQTNVIPFKDFHSDSFDKDPGPTISLTSTPPHAGMTFEQMQYLLTNDLDGYNKAKSRSRQSDGDDSMSKDNDEYVTQDQLDNLKTDLNHEITESELRTNQKMTEMQGHIDTKFAEMTGHNDSKFANVDTKFAAMTGHNDAKFASLDAKFAEIDAKFAEVNGKIDTSLATITAKLDNIPSQIKTAIQDNNEAQRKEHKETVHWIIGTIIIGGIGLVVAIASAVIALLALLK